MGITRDDMQTMYAIANQSVLSSMDDRHKVSQIAACAALFAMSICKGHGVDARECSLEISFFIHQLMKSPDETFKALRMSEEKPTSGRGAKVRENGMDYTSSENIHKVLDPLFLNDLKEELAKIKATEPPEVRARMLIDFQNKLASLNFLDPACGCGNFLVETYISLRKLENEIIAELKRMEATAVE